MSVKKAVAERLIQLCQDRKINIHALGIMSGVSPSTIYSILDQKSKNPGIVTLKKLCDGLNISITEFFNTRTFKSLEQELK